MPLRQKVVAFFDPSRLPPDGEERRGRRRGDAWRARFEKFWLAFLTALWIWTAVSLGSTQSSVDEQRVEGTRQRCELARAVLDTAVDLGVPENAPTLDRLRQNLSECVALLEEIKGETG